MYPCPDMPAFGTFIRNQVENVRQQGVDIDVLFFNGRKSRLNYLWAFPRLYARLLTRRYDLIHANYVFSGVVARAQFLYPVVLTHTGAQVFRGKQAPLCRWISGLVDRVIVRSQEMKEKLGCQAAEIIPAGVNMDLFKPLPQRECRESLKLPMNKKLILWAGEYFRPEKRFDIVQKAVPLVQQKIPEAELVLATGLPQHLVPVYMNACDVLLLVSDAEGSPNVVKEAMACNLPIVSVPAGDVSDVIANTDGCFLCSQDPQDVAGKLVSALAWGKRTNGREKIGHLEIGYISQRIISLYQDLLAKKRGRGLAGIKSWLGYKRRNDESMYR